MRQSAVMFTANGLSFEGVLAIPGQGGRPVPGVAICHPHPLFGGSMDNNVVVAVSHALVEVGFATLRFNFRGVGNSQGEHSKGELEHQEAMGALEFLKNWPGVNGRRLGLAGYSFGASVILGSAALQKRSRALVLVSPPLRALKDTPLKADKGPKLVIAGDRDRLVQSEELPSVLASFAYPPELKIVAGADHGWLGKEGQLCDPVSQFFFKYLK